MNAYGSQAVGVCWDRVGTIAAGNNRAGRMVVVGDRNMQRDLQMQNVMTEDTAVAVVAVDDVTVGAAAVDATAVDVAVDAAVDVVDAAGLDGAAGLLRPS